MTVTIYHNPACGTSRNVLALIRAGGATPEVIEYLQTPPSRDTLKSLAARMGLPVRDLLRRKGTPYDALGLDDPALTDDQLLDAIEQHPTLLNRPIVVTPRGVKLCRPSETVLDLLPQADIGIAKEDGTPFLADERIVPDESFRAALTLAGLPRGALPWADVPGYVLAQLIGAVLGVWLAHIMFGLPILQASTHVRTGFGLWVGEFTATFALLSVIWSCVRHTPSSTPYAVA